MKVNPGAIGLYGFGVLLLYLAGMYFGSYLLFLFYLSLFYPAISLLLTVAAMRRFRFRQSWDHGRPIKGQQFKWTLTLINGSVLPLYRVDVRFMANTPLPVSEGTDFRFFLKPREEISQSHNVRLTFRGIYTVGIDTIEIKDFLQLFCFPLAAEPRTFDVYPSIHKLDTFSTGDARGEGSLDRRFRDVLPDYTLFSHLREYRPGESLKHISWKKFASRGIPLIREYESVFNSTVSIYLDLRLPFPSERMAMTPAQTLTLEDTSVELLVALVHNYLDRGIQISVVAPGGEPFRFIGSRPEHFQDLYRATLGISFHDTYSVARLQQDGSYDRREGGSTIFITHLVDRETVSAAEQVLALNQPVSLIYNKGVPQADRDEFVRVNLDSLRNRGVKIFVVESPAEIQTISTR
jgi:uncharacterized protein (DUF58 family)